METLDRDVLFVALTRPQMLLGVTFGYLIANAIVSTELFLIFRSAWIVPVAMAVHIGGLLACIREPRIFDLWAARARHCSRVPNYRIWGCNSYRP